MTTMKDHRVLAIDPGKLTGVAYLTTKGQKVTLDWSGEPDPNEVIPLIRTYIADGEWVAWEGVSPLRLVIESFTINAATARKSQEASWALRTIGAIEQACRDSNYPLDAIVWQRPADVKNAFPNPRLKELGLWHKGGKGHALDAIRHGALYLAKTYASSNT